MNNLKKTNLFCLYANHETHNFQDTLKENCWRKAMEDEIHAIEKKKTWELTTLPQGQRTIGVKWAYKFIRSFDGKIDCYKVRLVAKGYK